MWLVGWLVNVVGWLVGWSVDVQCLLPNGSLSHNSDSSPCESSQDIFGLVSQISSKPDFEMRKDPYDAGRNVYKCTPLTGTCLKREDGATALFVKYVQKKAVGAKRRVVERAGRISASIAARGCGKYLIIDPILLNYTTSKSLESLFWGN